MSLGFRHFSAACFRRRCFIADVFFTLMPLIFFHASAAAILFSLLRQLRATLSSRYALPATFRHFRHCSSIRLIGATPCRYFHCTVIYFAADYAFAGHFLLAFIVLRIIRCRQKAADVDDASADAIAATLSLSRRRHYAMPLRGHAAGCQISAAPLLLRRFSLSLRCFFATGATLLCRRFRC